MGYTYPNLSRIHGASGTNLGRHSLNEAPLKSLIVGSTIVLTSFPIVRDRLIRNGFSNWNVVDAVAKICPYCLS